MFHPSQATVRCLRNLHVLNFKNTLRTRLASTLPPFVPESPSPPPDLQIFDIFDAPSRLGEARELLHKKPSFSPAYLPSPRSSNSPPTPKNPSRFIKPLPAPIVFDGPAHPTHMVFISYRPRRGRSISPARGGTDKVGNRQDLTPGYDRGCFGGAPDKAGQR